jgi:hypothetical protein
MTSTLPLFNTANSRVREAIEALRRDLIDPEDGPRISTMRNYRFAIVQYSPEHEYAMRTEVQRLVSELEAKGWFVLTIDLQKLLLDRIRSQPDDWSDKVIAPLCQESCPPGLTSPPGGQPNQYETDL